MKISLRPIFILLLLANSLLHSHEIKPNIIFILTDDMGWGDMTNQGHPYLKTPNIDRLVAEGTVFDQFYVQSAVCSPSRTAFVTGHFPQRHKIFGHFSSTQYNRARGMPDFLDPETVLLPHLMKESGYRTIHIGKWHLAQVAPSTFQTYQGKPPRIDVDDYGFDVFLDRFHFNKVLSLVGGAVEKDYMKYSRAYSTGLYVQQAIQELARDPEIPKFINLWTLVPHATLIPTPEELAEYSHLDTVSAADFPEPMRTYLEEAEDPVEQMKIYCAAMTGLDKQIGVLLDELEKQGLRENTLIIFSSDNGPEDYHVAGAADAGMGSTNNLVGRKRSNYEGGVRTPLIVSWPDKIPSGKRNKDSVIAAVDLIPTLASISGQSLPESFNSDGEDVSDIFLGSDRLTSRPLFWETIYGIPGNPMHNSPRLSVRDGDWKFHVNADGSQKKLFNIPQDPGETRNLAEVHPEVLESLELKLKDWQESLPKRLVTGE